MSQAPSTSTTTATPSGSTAAPPAPSQPKTGPATPQLQRSGLPGWLARHHFLLRRLHSLSGVLPIGAFVFEHCYVNFSIILGAGAYQTDVNFIWALPGLLWLEIFGIWLPIAFHAALGIVYCFTGRPNSHTYSYADNRRYTWMRITGVIALVYIFFHMATTRWHWTFGGIWVTPFDPTDATLTTAYSVQYAWPWVLIFQIVGALAVTYHLANGLWTFAITWGMTVTVGAMRRWGWICLVFGLLMAAAWMVSLWYFSVYPLPTPATTPTPISTATGAPTIFV